MSDVRESFDVRKRYAEVSVFYLRLWNVPEQMGAIALQQKDGAYLSPNGRLSGIGQAAIFTSEALALKCKYLWMPRLQARSGNGLRVDVERWTGNVQFEAGDLDAVTLIARARSGCFASNKRVPLVAIEAARAEVASSLVC